MLIFALFSRIFASIVAAFSICLYVLWVTSERIAISDETRFASAVATFDPGSLTIATIGSILAFVWSFWIYSKSRSIHFLWTLMLIPLLEFNLVAEPWLRIIFHVIRSFSWVLPMLILIASVYICRPFHFPKNISDLLRNHEAALLGLLVCSISFFASCNALPHLALTGDEPHYVKIVSSILEDFDLDLANQEPGYSPAWPSDWRRLHHLNLTEKGDLISIHSPGLPALLSLPYLMGGRIGISLFLCLIMGASAYLCFNSALFDHLQQSPTESHSRNSCFWLILLTFLGSPLLLFSFQIYPEIIAAVGLLFCVQTLLDAKPSSMKFICSGAIIGYLPWLHIKYAAVSLVIYLLFLSAPSRLKMNVLLLSIAPFFSVAVLSTMNYRYYGSFFPFAAYSSYVQSTSIIETNIFYGFGFYLLDGRHSFLLYGSLYISAAWIVTAIWRNSKRFLIIIALPVITHGLIVAGHVSDRWLGWSPPLRFWIPILPLLLIGISRYASLSKTSSNVKSMIWMLALIQIAVSAGMIAHPELIHQRSSITASREAGRIHLQSIFPLTPDGASPITTLALSLILPVILFVAVALLNGRHPSNSGDMQIRRRSVFQCAFLFFVLISSVSIFHRLSEYAEPESADYQPEKLKISNLHEFRNSFPDTLTVVQTQPVSSGFNLPDRMLHPVVGRFEKASAPVLEIERAIDTIHSLCEKGRELDAMNIAEQATRQGGQDEMFPYLLDLHRARRAWDQVIQLIDSNRIDGNIYSKCEINRIRNAARLSLVIAYQSLLSVSTLTPAKRTEIESTVQHLKNSIDDQDLRGVPFRALPELGSWGYWPT